MVILKATCRNGIIELETPLPAELEGKQVQLKVEEVKTTAHTRRKAGSAAGKIWIAPDFDEPLADFKDYLS